MGALLIDRWLEHLDAVPVLDQASTTLVRELVRDEGRAAGLDDKAIAALATAATELATNQLLHARLGSVAVRRIEQGGVPGVEVLAADAGYGIANPKTALAGRTSTTGLGAGLSGARRLCDGMDIDVRVGEGTCIRVRKLVAAPRVPMPEVGIYAVPHPDEPVCGDDAAFARADGVLSLVVADGLGHGRMAREASTTVVETFMQHPHAVPTGVLASCDGALVGTRGAVVTAARWDLRESLLEHAAAGNVATIVHRHAQPVRLSGHSLVLGNARAARSSIRLESVETYPRDVIAVYTDGLSTRTKIEADWAGEHPVVIAQLLAETYGRGNDDTLVLVTC